MKVNVSKPESWKIVLDIEVPEDMVKHETSEAFDRLQKLAALPGFRKGKAPLDVVKQHFTTEARKEVIEKLIPEAVSKALKEHNVEVVSIPSVYDLEFEFNQPLKFKTSVEIKPQIEPKSYKKIKVKKRIVKIDEENVNKKIEELREANARLLPSLHLEAKEGDLVLIDYEGPKLDELKEPFKIEKKTNQLIKVLDEGTEKFLPGFTKSLIGSKSGQTRQVKVVFPLDHKDKNLSGKEIVFNVTVHQIKEKKPPDVNDEFAKELGFENLDKLKTRITENLTKREELEVKQSMENQIIDALIENNDLECPPSLVEQEIDYIVARTMDYFKMQGVDIQKIGIKDDELRQRCREDAVRKVKTDLIVDSIAQKENIEVLEDEINKQIEEMIKQTKKSPEEVKEYFNHYRESIIAQMRHQKTFNFLLDNAKVKQAE